MYEKRGSTPTPNRVQKRSPSTTVDPMVRDYSVRSSSNAPRKRTSPNTIDPAVAARRREAKRQAIRRRKITFFAILVFFLFALVGLIFAIVFAVKSCAPAADGLSNNSPSPLSQPDSSPQISDLASIPEGAMVNGISIGNMTVADARNILLSQLPVPTVAITISGNGVNAVFDAASVGASWNLDAALSDAIAGGNVSAKLIYDDNTLVQSLTALNQSIPNHAVDATFEIQYNSDGSPEFVYVDGQQGMQLDYDAIRTEIAACMDNGEYTKTIVPVVTVSDPAVTVDELKAQTAKLSSFTTTYRFKGTSGMTEAEKQNCEARDVNITKASTMMHSIVLSPGEVFSFNDTTGERSEKNGWALANAVYDGGYQLEPGGGVCQVSTTMFNALLRANVEIVNRKGHTIPSDYVDSNYEAGLGFDATVDWGHTDFKFRNDTDSPLYVFVYITTNKESSRKRDINVEIYGKYLGDGVSYRTRNEITVHEISDTPVYKEDKSQPTGYDVITKKAHDHYVVISYIDKYVDGKYVETVLQFKSDYPLIQETHTVGVGGTAAPTTPTPKPTSSGGGSNEPVDTPYIPDL